MKNFVRLALSALMFFATTLANSATITINATIDLEDFVMNGSYQGLTSALNQDVTVTSGDTVNLNIDFLGNQTLTWRNTGSFAPWLMLDGYAQNDMDPTHFGSFTWSNLSINFLNLTQGTQFQAYQLAPGSSGSIHLGPFVNADFITRTFSGVNLSFLTTFTDGDIFRTYGSLGYGSPLFYGPASYTQNSVPEPSTTTLLSIGILVFLLLRRTSKLPLLNKSDTQRLIGPG